MGNKKVGREIPSKFWVKIAKKELERAEDALKRKDYPDCVFHSQQAVEKIVKGLLEINKIIVRDHYVADKVKKIVSDEKLIEEISWFEKDKKWEIARYPIEKAGSILTPEDVFTRKIAEDALKKARFVFEKIGEILKEKYGLSFEGEK